MAGSQTKLLPDPHIHLRGMSSQSYRKKNVYGSHFIFPWEGNKRKEKGKGGSCTSALLYSTIDLPEQEMASLVWEPDWEETPFSSSWFPTSLFVLCQLSNRVCSTLLLTCKCAGSGFALGRPVRWDTVDFNSGEIVSTFIWQNF